MTARLMLLAALLGLMMPVRALDRFATRTETNNRLFPRPTSLRIGLEGNMLTLPVVTLGGNERVMVEFDLYGALDLDYLRYEVLHCTAGWETDDLVASEYLTGFNEGIVDDYEFSSATLVPYVHYRIVLPNEQIGFTASGNYLLRVYPEDDPKLTVLQARFMVSEQAVGIAGAVTTSTDIDNNRAHQQLELQVDTRHYQVDDLYNDLRVVMTQNDYEGSRRELRHPLRVSGRTAVYEHQPELIFPAGNEYRRMETISTTYPSMRIDSVGYYELGPVRYYTMSVEPDESRADGRYVYDRTIRGRWLPREYNSSDPDTEADYVMTKFTLHAPGLDETARVFVEGDFANRRIDGTTIMHNEGNGTYTVALPLKQGAYSYRYVVRSNDPRHQNEAAVEGNFAPTVNEYNIMVYHRPRGSRYDRLIGVATIVND